MIYFLRATDGGPIKIGTTVRLTRRLKQLAAEFGPDVEVLAVAEGSYEEEALEARKAAAKALAKLIGKDAARSVREHLDRLGAGFVERLEEDARRAG